jgi:Raf kinase inhibitor-like YbhB/YbcL family protein
VTSAAFRDGATVPTRYTCDGANESPPLSWDASGGPGAPVLVVIDPDAGNFVHWAVLLPRGTTSLRPGALPAGSTQYENDFANARYDGPCPPAGSLHHYEFQVSLVGGGAGLLPGPGSSSHDLIEAIQDHLVAEGTLTGTYSRS